MTSEMLNFTTKAETLERIADRVRMARVLPQVRFTVTEWTHEPDAVLARIAEPDWAAAPVIVRSSAIAEDGPEQSLAGHFVSVAGVSGAEATREAIEAVFESFGAGADGGNQIFVQPMLADIGLGGVAFSCDPNTGGPYCVINYSTDEGAADAVTAGDVANLKTFYRHVAAPDPAPEELAPVVALLEELDTLFGGAPLDIEFARDTVGVLYLLQVRRLWVEPPAADKTGRHAGIVERVAGRIAAASKPHPYLAGNRAIYGVMPDWNPAEIIGVRPRPLALSLYRELVTDATWAYQRDNYGYRSLRGFPLLVSFEGMPYIDVRTSFNSFIPKDLDDALADRLVNYYLNRLADNPALHDKVEFEVVFSCYTLDLPERLGLLGAFGFSDDERQKLTDSLRRLTNGIIHADNGLWRQDREKIDLLDTRRETILASDLDSAGKIYWLLEDCRRYGTLPFAGLARAGFIAVQLLDSLTSVGILDTSDVARFMRSVETISSSLKTDAERLPRDAFLARYGHLRPGTYEIDSPRYDEAPDLYFSWDDQPAETPPEALADSFTLSLPQLRAVEKALDEHGLEHDVLGLFDFIRSSIEGREYAKFVFTRSLSDALSLFREFAAELGFSENESAYADIRLINELQATSDDPAALLGAAIADGQRRHEITQQLVLPPLITAAQNAWSFHIPPSEPNYVTQGNVTGRVVTDLNNGADLAGAIIMLPSADPGYDWIFSRNIAGFITKYGGVNSHMAIRAGELSIPAIVGAGEILYASWANANSLTIDCTGRRVQVLK